MARPRRIDWSKVQLEGRTLREVAEELGVSTVSVSYAKKRLGIPNTFGKKTGRIDWTGVDLSRRAREIAEEMGISIKTVEGARRRLGFTKPRRASATPRPRKERVRTFEDFEREFPE